MPPLSIPDAVEQAKTELSKHKHTPTKSAVTMAKRGLNAAKAHTTISDAATAAGRKIASGQQLSDDQVRTMASYHASHEYDCGTDESSAGDVEDMLWGGAPGAAWSAARSAAIDVTSLSETPVELGADDDLSLEIFIRNGFGEEIELDTDENGLIWAPILRSGTHATRPGPFGEKLKEPLVIVPGRASNPGEIGLENLLDNFNRGAVQHVTIPTTHENGVLDNALALDTPIPTPAGWTTMGEIEEGDFVFGSDGKPVRVLGVAPVQIDHDCFDVRFSDGSSIIADRGHLWETRSFRTAAETSIGGSVGVRTTEEIASTLRMVTNGGGYSHRVKVAQPLDLPEADLPVDPYFLGYWLGDGNAKDASISVDRRDTKSLVAQIREAGYATSVHTYAVSSTGFPTERPYYSVVSTALRKRRRVNPHEDSVRGRLRAIGVLGNKHIPLTYLRASFSQRLAVLQGLMDSDGTIDKECQLSLVDDRLAADALELIHSLGFRVCQFLTPGRGNSQAQHRMSFAVRDHVNVFRLPRKVERYEARTYGKTNSGSSHRRSIIAVDPIPSVPVRCIKVDSDDHLYLAGKTMIPTHNTGYIEDLKIVESQARPGERVLMGGHRITEPEVMGRLQRGSVANRSCGILHGYVNTETGEEFDQVLEHVALTNKPWIRGMAPYGELAAADGGPDLSAREIVPMTLSEVPKPTPAPKKRLAEPSELPKVGAVSTRMTDSERAAALFADVQWGETPSFNTIRSQVLDQLDDYRGKEEPGSPPYFDILDVGPDKALVRCDYGYNAGEDVWVVPFTADSEGVTLAAFDQWAPVQQAWITDDDADQDKKEMSAILGADGMPIPDPTALSEPLSPISHETRLLLPPERDNQQGGAMPPTPQEVLDRLGLSDDDKAALQQIIAPLVQSNEQMRTQLAESRSTERKTRVEARVKELQDKGFPSGFLVAYEEIALADDGAVAAVLNLSESGMAPRPVEHTATQLAERLINALPLSADGKTLEGIPSLVTDPLAGRPPLDGDDAAKTRGDGKPKDGVELAEQWAKDAPELANNSWVGDIAATGKK